MKKSVFISALLFAMNLTTLHSANATGGKSFEELTNAEKPIRSDISSDFTYKPKTVKVKDATIQYFDEGEGDPVVFIHGIPTWSYLWRNIMPHLEDDARVISIDLPGYGGSTRGSAKSMIDHTDYFEGFVNKLGLKDITLVIHDLGGGVGVMYAGRHPDNVKAIAFGESPIGQSYTREPLDNMVFPKKVSERSLNFYKMMHDRKSREQAIIEDDMFMPTENFTFGMTRQLTAKELDAYQKPFATKESRYAIADVVAGLTYDGSPKENYLAMAKGLKWLQTSDVPKLMFLLKNGNLMPPEVSNQVTEKTKNLTVVNLGEGRHFFQEDHPHKAGRHLKAWFKGLN